MGTPGLFGQVRPCQAIVTLGQIGTIPAIHAVQLADVLGLPAEELFAGTELTRDTATHHGARMSVAELERVVARARELSGEPALGLLVGLGMRVSGHGDLGFAVMTAPTARAALELAVRFAPTRTDVIALRLHEQGGAAAIVLDELVSLGSARDAVLFALGVGIWQIGNALTGRELSGAADFTFEEPGYFERFRAVAPGPIRFGQPQNQLVFDSATLELPFLFADPATSRLASEHCEEQLRVLRRGAHLVVETRALVLDHHLPEVARRLHLSERTLKRRLAAHGTSVSRLRAEQRLERALVLLRSGALSVQQIADLLGYADVANFTRAFRRWTGLTPGAYRRGDAARPGEPATTACEPER